MDTLLQDLRIALRSLLRRPGFTLGAVLTLGLGIGAATSIFSVVNGVLLTSLPYAEPETLVRIWQTNRAAPGPVSQGSVSPVTLGDWQERSRSFESIALYSTSSATVTNLGEADVVQAASVTPAFFHVMRTGLLVGRSFTDEENVQGGPRAIVISHGLWQERFAGRADVLGADVEIGGTPWQIVGVAPAGFDYPGGARLWFPLRPSPDCGRGCIYTNGIARLAPGVTLEQAQADMRAVALGLEEEYPDAHLNRTFGVATLHDVTVGGVRTALWLLLGAVLLVVLIACANVANLLLVRGAQRTNEIAVRAALGAGRARLVRQILTESLALAAIGGALGLLLALWGVSVLPALAADSLPRVAEIALDGRVVGFALALVIGTALLFGIVPALHLSRAPLGTLVRAGGRGDTNTPIRRYGRFALLAGEVGLSLLLLLGAGLLLRSFERLHAVPLGYDADAVTHFSVSLPDSRYDGPEARIRFFDEFKDRLAVMRGVTEVSYVTGLPLGASQIATAFERTDIPPPSPGEYAVARLSVVDTDYFATMRIPLLNGRAFEPADRHGAQRVAIISRRAAEQYWPGVDPIGLQIEVSIEFEYPEDQPRTIIGIVDDSRTVALRADPMPEIFVPYAQSGAGLVTYVLRSAGPPAPILVAAREELRARDPLLPLVRPGTMRELVNAQLADTRFYVVVLSLFAVLALVLAAVGIYSVVAFLVTRRTREIGVRIALGARAGDVVRGIVIEGVVPALVGVVLGIAGALAATRVIASLLYETTPHDPLAFAAAAALLLATVALACLVPALRAASIPPSIALREE